MIRSSVMYPFGCGLKENTLQLNNWAKHDLKINFEFGNKFYNRIIIATDGFVCFDPIENEKRKYIMVFGSSINTHIGGTVFYREENDPFVLELIKCDIYNSLNILFIPKWSFIVTWYKVTQYNGSPNVNNTFQLVLATDGNRSFTIFNYDKIMWSHMYSSKTYALAGFFNNNTSLKLVDEKNRIYLKENSPDLIGIELTSNVNVPGRYVFQVDNLIN